MRALWVTNEPPDRQRGGGNIRQSHLLPAVANRYDVDLLMVGSPPDEQTVAAVKHLMRAEGAPPATREMTARARRIKALRLALGAGPGELFDGREARKVLSRMWPDGPYDLVLVEHAAMAPLIRHRRPGERWVCTMQYIGSGNASALRDLTAGGRQRWAYDREATLSRALERRVLRDFDLVVTVSQEDADLLHGPSVVVPNGVDLSAFGVTPVPSGHHLVFTGTLGYLPNVDGLEWFCAEVLPLVRAVVPDVVFDIVGRDPVDRVRALVDDDGVRLHANVPRVQPYLEQARVCVVPLRIGTGSRLKALEAMASGRPVVGTTVGLAGLALSGEALVADEPALLAAHLASVLTDDAVATQLADAGRAHVERSFGWDAVGRRLAKHLDELSQRP